MEFNQFADSALSSLLETTKFLKEITDGKLQQGMKKTLKDCYNLRQAYQMTMARSVSCWRKEPTLA